MNTYTRICQICHAFVAIAARLSLACLLGLLIPMATAGAAENDVILTDASTEADVEGAAVGVIGTYLGPAEAAQLQAALQSDSLKIRLGSPPGGDKGVIGQTAGGVPMIVLNSNEKNPVIRAWVFVHEWVHWKNGDASPGSDGGGGEGSSGEDNCQEAVAYAETLWIMKAYAQAHDCPLEDGTQVPNQDMLCPPCRLYREAYEAYRKYWWDCIWNGGGPMSDDPYLTDTKCP